jgi:hypothetical protein
MSALAVQPSHYASAVEHRQDIAATIHATATIVKV